MKQREHEEKLLKESEAKQRQEEQRLTNWHEEEEHRLSVEARRKEEENRKKVFEAKLQKATEEGERLFQLVILLPF